MPAQADLQPLALELSLAQIQQMELTLCNLPGAMAVDAFTRMVMRPSACMETHRRMNLGTVKQQPLSCKTGVWRVYGSQCGV